MNKDLYFEYIEDFADYIVDRTENDEGLFLSIIGKFEEIKDIIKSIIVLADAEFDTIDIQSPDVCGYTDEYVLDCWCDGGLLHIGCEPAKRDGEYLNFCGDETYLLSNCSSKLIPLCDDLDLYFVNFDEECECCVDCDECCLCGFPDGAECSEADESDIHGFTATKSTGSGYHSYSFYTSDNLSKSDIHDMLKEFGF